MIRIGSVEAPTLDVRVEAVQSCCCRARARPWTGVPRRVRRCADGGGPAVWGPPVRPWTWATVVVHPWPTTPDASAVACTTGEA